MDYCTFFGTKLKNTHFVKCSLKEADFTESDLSSAVFNDTDLTGTRFLNTILEKADFRNAKNFAIDPEFNKIKKAKFSAFQLEGLLYKYQLIISWTKKNNYERTTPYISYGSFCAYLENPAVCQS